MRADIENLVTSVEKSLSSSSLKDIKIASFMRWDLPFEDGIRNLTDRALKRFEDLGASVEVVNLPMPMEKVWEAWITLRSWSISNSLSEEFKDLEKRKLMKKPLLWEINRGLSLKSEDIVQASKTRSEWFEKMASSTSSNTALAVEYSSARDLPIPILWAPCPGHTKALTTNNSSFLFCRYLPQ